MFACDRKPEGKITFVDSGGSVLKGIILIISGVVGVCIVYSFRPPSGFGDAIMMLGNGRNYYLKEPVYLGLMAVSVIASVIGLTLILKNGGK